MVTLRYERAIEGVGGYTNLLGAWEIWLFKYEAQTALFKYPVRTAQ